MQLRPFLPSAGEVISHKDKRTRSEKGKARAYIGNQSRQFTDPWTEKKRAAVTGNVKKEDLELAMLERRVHSKNA